MRMTILTICAAMLLGGFSAPAAAQANEVVYQFPSDWPRYVTTLLVLRNETKMRPVVLTGRGGGSEFRFNAAEPARSTGRIEFEASRYNAARADMERMVATQWLAMEQRPSIRISIEQITNWQRDTEVRGTRYNVTIGGFVQVNNQRTAFEAPATMTFADAGRIQGHAAPDRVYVRSTFTVKGEELGLTGDDAGDLSMQFSACGFVR